MIVCRSIWLQTPPAPNPFFGTKVVKKATVHVKDDFNPFKHNKVAEASNISMAYFISLPTLLLFV